MTEITSNNKQTKSKEETTFLGYWWWLFIVFTFLVGICLITNTIYFPDWITRLIPMVKNNKFHLFLGIFVIALPISHIFSHIVSLFLSSIFKLKPWTTRENLFPPAIIGLFESVMYPIFFLLGKPEYIGAWLALKVAGSWKQWQEDAEARRRFYKFLIGNLVTISIATLVYIFILSFVWGN
jgi:hypothetical protein